MNVTGICQRVHSTLSLVVHRKNVSLCDNGFSQFNVTSDVSVSCSSNVMTSYIVAAGIKRHSANDTSWTDITLALSEACNGKPVCSPRALNIIQKSIINTVCDDAAMLYVSYVCLPGTELLLPVNDILHSRYIISTSIVCLLGVVTLLS